MITITDNRTKSDQKLDAVKPGQYFIFQDVLLRRVKLYDGYSLGADDGVPVVEISTGVVTSMRREARVEPLRDEQIAVDIWEVEP